MATKRAQLAAAVQAQRAWIDSCGGTIGGYVARYGADGESIYRADVARLQQLQQQLQRH